MRRGGDGLWLEKSIFMAMLTMRIRIFDFLVIIIVNTMPVLMIMIQEVA